MPRGACPAAVSAIFKSVSAAIFRTGASDRARRNDVLYQGPKEDLDNTVHSQPALFVAGLAAVEKLRAENPTAVEECGATAGLSLGEYTALVFAGALSFDDALKVVKVRQDAMRLLTEASQSTARLLIITWLPALQNLLSLAGWT